MLKEFDNFITQQKLFKEGDKILLAVSGGIDSVVMAHLFYNSKRLFGIAHCNFKLRKGAADADEKFVKKLASSFKVKFYSRSFNTKNIAKEQGISLQMAARNLRYEFFEEIRVKEKYDKVAVAHNAEDSAETVLLNLVRGTGIAGYHGILPANKNIVRPLLFVSRADILKFAKKKDIQWREDASNKKEYYTRNKIRLQVIPLLEKMNPSLTETLQQHILQMSEVELLYREYIGLLKKNLFIRIDNEIAIPIEELKKHAAIPTLIFELLKDFHFNSETAKEISDSLNAQSGNTFLSPTHKLIKDRHYLIIHEKKKKGVNHVSYSIPEDIHTWEWNHNRIALRKISLTSDLKEKIIAGSYHDHNIAYLDADFVKFPLTLRKWQKGDYFYPLGLNGKKLLSNYFIDRKFSLLKKEKAWILTSGNDIIWIIGERVDNRFKIKINSHTCLQLSVEKYD